MINLKEGDTVQCKGPFGCFEYKENGFISNKDTTQKVDKLTMIAGGSGITPIYQVFRYASQDGIECDVIYCNKTEDDILLRNELDQLEKLRYCLSQPNDQWTGLQGHICQDYIGEKHDGLFLCLWTSWNGRMCEEYCRTDWMGCGKAIYSFWKLVIKYF